MARSVLKFFAYIVATILLFGFVYLLVRRPWISRTAQTITVSFVLVHDSADVYTLTQLKINERDVSVGKTAVVLEGNTVTVDSLRKFLSR